MKLLNLQQRSPSWYRWRSGSDLVDGPRVTATMATILSGTSPWSTPHRLWLETTRRIEPRPVNQWMARGIALEPEARRRYSLQTGNAVGEACIEQDMRSWVAASLDGLSLFGDLSVEIKCPGEADHLLALAGKIPTKYLPQLQWQMLAGTGSIKKSHYFSFYPNNRGIPECALIEQFPDPSAQQELMDLAIHFRRCVLNDIPLAGTTFEQAALTWLELSRRAKAAQKLAEEAKIVVAGMLPAGQRSLAGGGVLVVRSTRGSGQDPDDAQTGSAVITVRESVDADLALEELANRRRSAVADHGISIGW